MAQVLTVENGKQSMTKIVHSLRGGPPVTTAQLRRLRKQL